MPAIVRVVSGMCVCGGGGVRAGVGVPREASNNIKRENGNGNENAGAGGGGGTALQNATQHIVSQHPKPPVFTCSMTS